jgi:toxin-antitoxin system PIN domain toxin
VAALMTVDVNLLVNAYNYDSAQNGVAKDWLESAFAQNDIGFSWEAINGFSRLLTNPAAMGERFTPQEIQRIVDDWLARPNVSIINPTERHWHTMKELSQVVKFQHRDVMDIHLAALAKCWGATLVTFDTGFLRFKKLDVLLLQ